MNGIDVESLSLPDLKRYLLKRGWQTVQHPNSRIEILRTILESDGDYFSVTLPASTDFSNSGSMIAEAVCSIAKSEQTTPERLAATLSAWGKDVLLARLFKIQGNENSLPLRVAADGINRLKDFMGYAAYTQADPRPHFEKAGSVSAAFTGLCHFGHTFHGSFGLRIECPIDVANVLPLEGVTPDVPFERQVFERIGKGINNLRRSIESDSLEPMVRGYQDGFSANMCWALNEAYEQMEGRRIEFTLLASPELDSPALQEWRPFVFDGRANEFNREAAKELEKTEVFPDSIVEGPVVALRSDRPPELNEQEEFDHIITMWWEKERNQVVNIRVPLNASDYRSACDAHKEGRRIRVVGVPEKSGKTWTLTRPHDFTVLTGGGR